MAGVVTKNTATKGYWSDLRSVSVVPFRSTPLLLSHSSSFYNDPFALVVGHRDILAVVLVPPAWTVQYKSGSLSVTVLFYMPHGVTSQSICSPACNLAFNFRIMLLVLRTAHVVEPSSLHRLLPCHPITSQFTRNRSYRRLHQPCAVKIGGLLTTRSPAPLVVCRCPLRPVQSYPVPRPTSCSACPPVISSCPHSYSRFRSA